MCDLFPGHFTKDCFSTPGLQYALLPDVGEEEPQPPPQPASAVPLQPDAEKKKKKKKEKKASIQTFLR